MIMTEHIDPIPDDLPTCQERLRAVLEQLHQMERRLRDLERQLDETCATTDELQRSYACLKEEYLALKRLFFGPRRERLPEVPGSNTSSMTTCRYLSRRKQPIRAGRGIAPAQTKEGARPPTNSRPSAPGGRPPRRLPRGAGLRLRRRKGADRRGRDRAA